MFAVNCPYCQHVNKRGARYCADCGAALHLKPCPKCGKVDEVTATKCINCGTAFPAIDLADYQPEPASGKALSGNPNEKNSAHAPSLRAGPLVVIALVAGGLPFLWMNRDRLPNPGESKGAASNGMAEPPALIAPAPALTPISAPTVEAPPVSTSANGASLPSLAPANIVSEHPSAVAEARRPASSDSRRVETPLAPRRNAPASDETVRRNLPEPREAQTAPTRECTESLMALGLCGPGRSGR